MARSGSRVSSSSGAKRDQLSTELRLALDFPRSHQVNFLRQENMEAGESSHNVTFYVKVYMEGIPIGRKLNLLAHDGYFALVATLNYMFNTVILWSEEDGAQTERFHVLTYEDKEGDWLMVGDVPWEMFLSSVKKLKVTRIG
ncbi:hypothetical protein SAY86_027608 [Trapa natans]|uniref:Auxin-responsive protein n=1 Tax=Trapa natans TaxID=22666 RepID=A0AAN7QKW9_TRANT|nr:hypothetical protein SAY86_027608 [Trapa natans]